MFKKHIIFQILYIIVGPLCPASLKRFVFYNFSSFQQAQFGLIGPADTVHCDLGRTPQALVGNVTPISIITSFSFQNECKDS